MLEEFFVVPATAERLRSCAFGTHLDEFCSLLVDGGYAVSTIRHKLRVLSDLAHWITSEHLAVVDLDEQRVDEFLEVRRRRGHSCRGFRSTALQLIEQLRCAGAVPVPESIRDDSPSAVLLRRYEGYLRQERGLADSTVSAYLSFARDLMAERLNGGGARPDSLCATDIREFLLGRVRRVAPTRAQYMGTALRSFLRFLFLRGETTSDLTSPSPYRRCAAGDCQPCRVTYPTETWSGFWEPATVPLLRAAETMRSSCSWLGWVYVQARSSPLSSAT